MLKLCIFEDSHVSGLAPVNYLRHTAEIICGAFSLLEKIKLHFPARTKFSFLSRPELKDIVKEKSADLPDGKAGKPEFTAKDSVLFVNSRTIFNKEIAKTIQSLIKSKKKLSNTKSRKAGKSFLLRQSGDSVCIFANGKEANKLAKFDHQNFNLNNLSALFSNIINIREIKNAPLAKIVRLPSDLINSHESEIQSDLKELCKKKKIVIGRKTSISKFVSYDTSRGPVYIGAGVTIEPFVHIAGPVYIGENSFVKAHSSIYGPVRIGSNCKVSGEISSSILHSFVNKQHQGFLGHSYLCEWVNLGAGTTTSNLKNNYSYITLKLGSEEINTNSIFLGSIIGDHTKTSINTSLNTGTLVGISSNLFGSGFHTKIVRSFSWDDSDSSKNISYEIDKAIKTARISMRRRKVELKNNYEKLLRFYFDLKSMLPV